MRLITLALATMLAFSSTFAFAHSHHRHHRTHSSGPNGAAGGGTSLSGTGSSHSVDRCPAPLELSCAEYSLGSSGTAAGAVPACGGYGAGGS
jgi:hypothetical protein